VRVDYSYPIPSNERVLSSKSADAATITEEKLWDQEVAVDAEGGGRTTPWHGMNPVLYGKGPDG
jgi:hypothetical protein